MLKFRSAGFFAAIIYLAVILALSLIYLRQASAFGTDAPLMPVDDAYIHFQYARQAAQGHPFVYNAGQQPSSGATSLLYPFILAIGYKLGFTGLNLGYWAYLIGVFALLVSALTVRAASTAAGLPRGLALMMGAAVASWGTLVWHAFSGMETALVVAFTLLTFYTFERRRLVPFIASASVLAMLRPEASIMAVLASLIYALREILLWRSERVRVSEVLGQGRQRVPYFLKLLPPILLPISFAAIQPLINLALTGSSNAAGSQAKSLLSIVPFDLGYIAGRVLANFAHAWETFLLGIGSDGMLMLPFLIGVSALFGLYRIARRRPLTALLPLLWLILIFGAISTLDTADWHFHRYHMPLLALAFPLSAHTVAALASRPRSRAGLIGYFLIMSGFLTVIYVDFHADNVESVAAQPLAMAHWISENTPSDALIAVHDVGLIRYLGGRETFDMVGLTTPGMADAWRNGPGAVGEALVAAPRRADYIAAYDDARGLSYLEESLYGERLAGFHHEFDPMTNVALGGPFQGIYQPSWQGADAATEPRVDAVRVDLDGFKAVDMLNVAELNSERAHDFVWHNISHLDGFASEIYLLAVPGCSMHCRVLDGGRRMNGGESFTLAAQAGQDHILISRFHAPNGGVIRIVINESLTVERTLPAIPGQFVEVPTLIPAELAASGQLHIRIEPVISGDLIFPYRHWLYAGDFESSPRMDALASFQNGSIALNASTSLDDRTLTVDLDYWTDGASSGDLIAFVHLYADLSRPPVVQHDQRPGGGALPPGAWLPGRLTDRVVLDLSNLPAGTYTLAVGFYDAVTFNRIEPSLSQLAPSDTVIDAGRILIDTVEVQGR